MYQEFLKRGPCSSLMEVSGRDEVGVQAQRATPHLGPKSSLGNPRVWMCSLENWALCEGVPCEPTSFLS